MAKAKTTELDAQVRRETREYGYERRPVTETQADEAERLERGFALLNDEDAE